MRYDHAAALAQDERACDIYRRIRAARQARARADAEDRRRASAAVAAALAAGVLVAAWVLLRGN
jgi:ferric-dicitrate binding protein FerR (iron transport regulator)